MGGKKGGSAKTPYIAPNTLHSKQKAKLVHLIGAGVMNGWGNGDILKSIRLDDTYLQNKDGSFNFSGIKVSYLNGDLNQDYLPNFDGIDKTYDVSARVRKDFPITRTVSDVLVTSLRITVGVDALIKQQDNGDAVPTSVDMSIQIIKNGQIYTSQHFHLNEKGNAPFKDDVIFRDVPQAPFDIKVIRITADSNDDKLRNNTYFYSYVETIDQKFSYPTLSIVGLELDSEQLGGSMPTITYDVKGREIKIPTNYNPETREYTGLWDGQFKTGFSNNPAWCLYDIITDSIHGLGRRFKASSIDKAMLYEIARYSDQLIDNGSGGKEPRYVFNGIIQGASAYDIINNLCSVFRGIAVRKDGKISFMYDRGGLSPVSIYTNSNVVDGKFSWSYTPLDKIVNSVQYEYANGLDGCKPVIEEISNDKLIAKYKRLNVEKITCYGSTNRSQAQRHAYWFLRTSEDENRIVNFSTGLEGIKHNAFDIVGIADNDLAGKNIGGRILEINGARIKLDCDLDNPKNFRIFCNTGVSESFEIKSVISSSEYELDRVVNANKLAVFTANLADVSVQLVKIISTQENDNGTYSITGVKYNPNKNDDVDNYANDEGVYTTYNPTPILSEPNASNQGDYILLEWSLLSSVGDEVEYNIQLFKDNVLYQIFNQKESELKLYNLPMGDYVARIKGRTKNGLYSETLVIPFSTTYNIQNLSVSDNEIFAIKATWQNPPLITVNARCEVWSSKELNGVYEKNASLAYPTDNFTIQNLSIGEDRYIKVRIVDDKLNYGEFTDPKKGSASKDSDNILSYLDGKITDSQISESLKEQFEKDINDAIESGIGSMSAEDMLANIALRTENETRYSQDSILSASTANNSATIAQLDTVVTDEFRAIAQREVVINSKIDENTSNITNVSQTVVNNEQAQSIVNNTTNAKFNENEAKTGLSTIALTTENEARAQNDSIISANVASNNAEIKRIDTVVVTNGQATAQAITSLSSRVGNNESTIVNINSTIATDKQAQASINSSLSSQIGDNKSSITAIQSTTATIDGKVSALYTMKVDANGNIAGMMIGADEFSSQVKFLADTFVVATPDQSINMFSLQTIEGKQYASFNADLIAKGTISGDKLIAGTEIQAPKITAGSFKGGNININDNFIVDSNGNLTANNGYFGGTIEASEIKGDIVNMITLNKAEKSTLEFTVLADNYNRFILISEMSIRFRSTGGDISYGISGRTVVSLNEINFLDQETKASTDYGGPSIGLSSKNFMREILLYQNNKMALWKLSPFSYFLKAGTPLVIRVTFTPSPTFPNCLLMIEGSSILTTRSDGITV